jgi:hypothetical protein
MPSLARFGVWANIRQVSRIAQIQAPTREILLTNLFRRVILPSHCFRRNAFNGRATSAHHVGKWVWGGHVQPWRARSLP